MAVPAPEQSGAGMKLAAPSTALASTAKPRQAESPTLPRPPRAVNAEIS